MLRVCILHKERVDFTTTRSRSRSQRGNGKNGRDRDEKKNGKTPGVGRKATKRREASPSVALRTWKSPRPQPRPSPSLSPFLALALALRRRALAIPYGFRRAGGIVIIIKGTLIKTRTTRRALRSASGAAPGTRRPRLRRYRRLRRPDHRRFRRRRRSDYPALHLGTSERARRRCQLRFKSRSVQRNATRRTQPAAGSPVKVGETIRRRRFININAISDTLYIFRRCGIFLNKNVCSPTATGSSYLLRTCRRTESANKKSRSALER